MIEPTICDLKFRKLYKDLLKKNSLNDFKKTSSVIKSIYSHAKVEKITVGRFLDIKGYKITIGKRTAFFPVSKSKDLKNNKLNGLSFLRNEFYEIGIVLPTLISNGDQEILLKALSENKDNNINEKIITDFFKGTLGLPELLTSTYSTNKHISKYIEILEESLKAYHLGLFKVAVISLLPCIEGVIRDLGVKASSVSSKELIENLIKLQRYYIKHYIFNSCNYVPQDFLDIKFHDTYDECIQVIESLRWFLEKSLYQNTNAFNESHSLNRHSILHALKSESNYGTESNFFRLINILNSLYFCSVFSGENGSLFHPSHTTQSEKLESKYLLYSSFKHLV